MIKMYKSKYYTPKYSIAKSKTWELRRIPMGFAGGYISDSWLVEDMYVLMRKNEKTGWESWMSLSPQEIESQQFGIEGAFGHTVVMGLGMGWFAINVALKDEVTKVTVIERDTEVINLFHESKAMDSLDKSIKEKIVIINEDALFWKSEEKVDFLYADIWLRLNDKNNIDQVKVMNENLKPDKIYYWGQELTIYRLIEKEEITKAEMENCIKGMEIPLYIPSDSYDEIINFVMKKRKTYM